MINGKIAEKVSGLKKDWRQALKEDKSREADICEARYEYYLKGIEDSVGFVRTCKIVKMSEELQGGI